MKLLLTSKIKATKAQTVSQAKDVFGWIDSDFKNWDTDVKDKDTKASNLSTYELTENGTFKDIYSKLSSNLDSLCLTQGQIIEFIKGDIDKTKWYFFLFKVNSDFFVARSYWRDGDLYARVDRFSFDFVWYAEFRHVFVVPQLTPSELGDLTPGRSDTFTLSISSQEDIDKAISFLKECGFTITKTF